MHPCLNLDEIVRLIAGELVASKANSAAAALACCRKSFEDPVLDVLWETQERLFPLQKTLPGDVWSEVGCFDFKRLPTTLEWARFRRYSRRMRKLGGLYVLNFLSEEALSVLQFHNTNEPLFPNMRALELWPTGNAIPFIPLFLSPRTTTISLGFFEPDLPEGRVASMIATFPTLCPNLQDICLHPLPRCPMIAASVSTMLLANNRDTLQCLRVDSPLTDEACEAVYTLPALRNLSAVIKKGNSLPTVVLPNLTELDVEYDHDHGWLQGFRGATLGKLASVTFRPEHKPMDNFLDAFEKVALTTSIRDTLSRFCLHTSYPWNPNYSSLLPFTQLTYIAIGFSCDGGCPSTVDDDIITDLARTMPKLETLELGGVPCREVRTGVTAKGLAVLAHHCPDLSSLRMHFQVASLGMAPDTGATALRRGCALRDLEVGEIPMPEELVLAAALTLGRIFPHMECIYSVDDNWEKVVDAICDSREVID